MRAEAAPRARLLRLAGWALAASTAGPLAALTLAPETVTQAATQAAAPLTTFLGWCGIG